MFAGYLGRCSQASGRRRGGLPCSKLGLAFLACEFGRFLSHIQGTYTGLHFVIRQCQRRGVGGHTASSHLARAHFHRLSVALVLQRVGGEKRFEELGIGQRSLGTCGRGPRHPLGRLDLQLELVRHGLEAVRLLIHTVGEGFCHLGKLALRLLLFELCLHGGAQFFKRGLTGCLDIGELDDVVPKLGLHQVTDFAFLQRKSSLFEGLDHGTPGKEIQVAARSGRALVVRGLLRDFGKRAWRLANLGQQLGGTGLGLLAVCRGCILGSIHQDVACAALFLRRHASQVLFVVGAQVVFTQGDGSTHAVEIEHHVLDGCLFQLLELGRVGFVVSLQIRIRGGDLAGEIGGIEARNLNLAALIQSVERELDLGIGAKCSAHHTTHHLVHRDVTAHIGFKPFRCQALCSNQGAVGVGIERAVRALEPCNRRDFLQAAGQTGIAGHKVHLLRRSCQHAVTHQALQRGIAGTGRVQQLGIDRGRLGTDAVGLHAMGIVPVRLVDVVAIDTGHYGTLFREIVAVDAYQHKRRNDQQEQEDHHDLGVLADGFKHGRSFRRQKTKGELAFAFVRWWWVLTVSNRRPTPCKGAALPTELRTLPKLILSSRRLSMPCQDGTSEL